MGAVDGKASPATDFAEPETKFLDLPRPGSRGQVLTVQIRALQPIDLIRAMEGVPQLNRATGSPGVAQSFEEMRQALLQQDGPQRRIAEMGVLDPKFSFGDAPEEGKAPWSNVHGENQAAIVAGIMDLSGFSEKKGGGQPAAESFRDVAGQ